MILKVKTGSGDWKYYEGFYAVEVMHPLIDVGIEADEYHYDPDHSIGAQIGCTVTEAAPNRPVNPVKPKVRMVRMSYPSDKTIVFDTEGYLLNYEGKTIERL